MIHKKKPVACCRGRSAFLIQWLPLSHQSILPLGKQEAEQPKGDPEDQRDPLRVTEQKEKRTQLSVR